MVNKLNAESACLHRLNITESIKFREQRKLTFLSEEVIFIMLHWISNS